MRDADLLSTEQAADLLLCGEGALLEAIKLGEVPAVKIGKAWVIPRAELVAEIGRRAAEESRKKREAHAQPATAQPVPQVHKAARRGRPLPVLPPLPTDVTTGQPVRAA